MTYHKLPLAALFPPGPGGGSEVSHGYKGKGSLLHLVVDKEGKPLWITSASAKGNERDQALVLLDHLKAIQIKNSKQMTFCEADKGYDSDFLRQDLLNRGYLPFIGYTKHRKEIISTAEIANFFVLLEKDGS